MDAAKPLEKLEEVQRVIRMYIGTKERLEKDLEAAECSSGYREELEEVVSKISELQAQEKLQMKILISQGYEPVGDFKADNDYDPLGYHDRRKASIGPPSPGVIPLSPFSRFGDARDVRSQGASTEGAFTENDHRSRQYSGEHEQPPVSPLESSMRSMADRNQRPPSPMKNHLRVYMPNNQRTMIVVSKGKSVREALRKKMSNRNLNCNMCRLQRTSDDQIIDWDTDTSELDGQELTLQYLPEYSFRQRIIPHVLIRKTFFRLSYCDFCHSNIMKGYVCDTCDIKFHARCTFLVSTAFL